MKRDYIFLCLFSLSLLVVCYSDQQSPRSYSSYSNHSSLPNELKKRPPPPQIRPRSPPPPPPHRSPPPPPRRSPPPPPPPPHRSPTPPPSRSPPPPPPKFDYLLLAETWPAAFCLSKPCRSYIPSKFTIHGLWPTNKMGSPPAFCDPNQKFNLIELYLLELQLLCDWPDLNTNSERYSIWSYQWRKHGTCSGMKIKDYFELALKVHNTNDFTSILEKEGITPNDKISIKKERIVNAIHKRIGVYPQLSCIDQSKKIYLAEIRLCFTVSGNNKDVEYQSCNRKYTSNCKASEDIYYIPVKEK